MSKQLKKFCHISKYIEKTDPKFYDILEDMCMLPLIFRPRRGHNGLTFIWPSKTTIAKLDKMRYSEDIDNAYNIVLAHIINDYIPAVSSWVAKKDDIPNGMNNKVEVQEVKGQKVILKGGVEIEHDPAFRMFSKSHNNQAVWAVTKGDIDPKNSTQRATFKYAREAQGGPPMGSRSRGAKTKGGCGCDSVMGGMCGMTGGADDTASVKLAKGVYRMNKTIGTALASKNRATIINLYWITSPALLTSEILMSANGLINVDVPEKVAVSGIDQYMINLELLEKEFNGYRGVAGGSLQDDYDESHNNIVKYFDEATAKMDDKLKPKQFSSQWLARKNIASFIEVDLLYPEFKKGNMEECRVVVDLMKLILEGEDNTALDLGSNPNVFNHGFAQRLNDVAESTFGKLPLEGRKAAAARIKFKDESLQAYVKKVEPGLITALMNTRSQSSAATEDDDQAAPSDAVVDSDAADA